MFMEVGGDRVFRRIGQIIFRISADSVEES